MATQKATTTADALCSALTEIALIADAADNLCFHQPLPLDADHAEGMFNHLRDVICRMGWIAERGAALGVSAADMPREARAEAWLMSPSLASHFAPVEASRG